jgi:hypothetical protein
MQDIEAVFFEMSGNVHVGDLRKIVLTGRFPAIYPPSIKIGRSKRIDFVTPDQSNRYSAPPFRPAIAPNRSRRAFNLMNP